MTNGVVCNDHSHSSIDPNMLYDIPLFYQDYHDLDFRVDVFESQYNMRLGNHFSYLSDPTIKVHGRDNYTVDASLSKMSIYIL